MSIYKACDIRGRFGTELTAEHACRLGKALVQIKGRAPVLVGGDGRLSTPLLKDALVASLLQAGCDVVDLGLISTPMFYFARGKLGLNIGVMVTASHNPAEDNGFKITLGPLPVTEEDMAIIAQKMESAGEQAGFTSTSGSHTRLDIVPAYLNFARPYIPDLSGLTIAIDCASGMNSLAARRIWEQTGAAVELFWDEVDGRFPAHAPNPAEKKNLQFLQEQVLRLEADLGIAYDGDGDRVAFVDERGQAVGGDKAIVLFARAVLRGGPETIIYDQKCSRTVPEMIQSLGGTALVQPSGHTYIKRAFLDNQAAYAGELSGHHFLRPFGDDALLSSLYFARLLKESGKTLSQAAASIPEYAITPDIRVPMPAARVAQVIQELEAELRNEALLTRTDGLRIEYPDGWGLVRPSVTEPVITLRFEGINEAVLQRIVNRVEEIVPEVRGKIRT